ncbi:MAG: hypothetical protein RLZZ246_1947 [Planctomycetota bacterium]
MLTVRLEAGAKEYGDRSFYKPGTAEEILQELVDVAGWAFVAWVQMRMRLQGLELAAQQLVEDPSRQFDTEREVNLGGDDDCN